jgi:hypothetical protein
MSMLILEHFDLAIAILITHHLAASIAEIYEIPCLGPSVDPIFRWVCSVHVQMEAPNLVTGER